LEHPLPTPSPSPTTLKWFSALTGLTSLSVLAQAVIAGEFVSQKHRTGWIDVHDVVADVVAVLALATMIFTIVALRKTSRALVIGTIVLFVLVVAQIAIGHQITDNKQDWLIAVHVPLAFIIFGIAIWLPINAVALRRANAKSA
jgi:lipopolysaccharide export LptBFGC system permease protein LptF